MKVLLINASPKVGRSNSLRLADAFVRGLGEAEVERLDLCSLDIKPCRGCFACWKATPGTCCIHDDMARVIEREREADLVVLSFPLYYFNLPGPLKTMIDRQLPMNLPFMTDDAAATGSGAHPLRYPEMASTRFVAISTCGFYTAEKNYDAVERALDHWPGRGAWDAIFCGQGELFSIPELSARTDAYLEVVERAGREYAAGGITRATRAELARPLYPREAFEQMANASWGVDERGERTDEMLAFTRQMAALYNPATWDGADRVVEIRYRDRGVSYQMVLGERGSTVLTDGFRKPTTVIDTPWDVWCRIARGEIRGDVALAQRLYSVEGDFDLMMGWDRIFGAASAPATAGEAGGATGAGGAASAAAASAAAKPAAPSARTGEGAPSMATMLVAWICLWVAAGVDGTVGPVVTLAVCALLPLAQVRRRLCAYDRISLGLVGGFAALMLLTGLVGPFYVASYAAFGALWLVSCATPEPLCAAYVKYGYGGDDALANPIFMRANRILAMAWGVLYLLIALWTALLGGMVAGWVLPVVNNVATALMGVFTVWFERRYPAWVASGKGLRELFFG